MASWAAVNCELSTATAVSTGLDGLVGAWVIDGRTLLCRPALALGRDELAGQRDDLGGEATDEVGVVGAHDEGAHPHAHGEVGELLGPVVHRACEEPGSSAELAEDVVDPADVLRSAARGDGRLIEAGVEVRERGRVGVAHRRDPTVRELAGDPDHPRLVGTEPDRDVVGRRWPGLEAARRVVLALEPTRLPRPERPDDRDRLDEGVDRLLGRLASTAGRLDPVPEGTGTQPQLDPPTGEDVQARGGLGQHDRRSQREVGDVGGEANLAGAGTDRGEQGPGVEVGRLVGVVLDAHVVEPHHVGELRELEDLVVPGGVGAREDAELQVEAIVGHGLSLAAS